MSKRLKKFRSFRDHEIQKKLMNKLTLEEIQRCEEFILKNDHLSLFPYNAACNRWFLDQPKPKNHATMWALVLQANENLGGK